MRKILNYVLIVLMLTTVLFALTGCAKEETTEIVVSDEVIENVENVETEDTKESQGDGNFEGIYVTTNADDPMEGLAIIPSDNDVDKIVFIKDTSGSGCTRVDMGAINGNEISEELAGETFTIKDLGTNVSITHPMFTFDEVVEMAPVSSEFSGVYQKENTALVVFKDINDCYTVAYINTRYDTSTCLTMKDYTINGNTLEGKDDVYSEPMKLVLNGDTLTFSITSEDSRWNSANTDFTLLK